MKKRKLSYEKAAVTKDRSNPFKPRKILDKDIEKEKDERMRVENGGQRGRWR